jgi:hypothetical protein
VHEHQANVHQIDGISRQLVGSEIQAAHVEVLVVELLDEAGIEIGRQDMTRRPNPGAQSPGDRPAPGAHLNSTVAGVSVAIIPRLSASPRGAWLGRS